MRVNSAHIQNFFNSPIGILIIAAILTATIFAITPSRQPVSSDRDAADAYSYIQIANGNIHEVMRPFAGRFLHPFLAGWTSRIFSINLTHSFLLITTVSLFFFFAIIIFIIKKTTLSYHHILPFLFLPIFLRILHDIFLPDIFYIFLTALFFLFVFHQMEIASIFTLFLLFLSRESTMLLGIIYFAVSLLQSKKLLSLTIFIVMVVSILTTSQINNIGLPNTHQMNNVSYIVFKIPFYFLQNVLGIRPWVNTLHNCDVPVAKIITLPSWRLFGAVHQIGFCQFDHRFPLMTLLVLLTTFGILPAVVLYYLIHNLKSLSSIIKRSPPWFIIALIFGLSNYIIGITVTTAIERLAIYSWPAFILVALFLLKKYFHIDNYFLIKLSLMNLFIAWLPFVIQKMYGLTTISMLFVIIVALIAYFYIFDILKIGYKNI